MKTFVRLFSLLAILALVSFAQVTVAVSPVPQQVLSALGLRTMGMASVYVVNNSNAQRTLQPEQVYAALITAQPVDPSTAQLLLTQRQSASAPASAARYLGYAAQIGSIVLAALSKSNISTAFWIGAAGAAEPQLQSFFTGIVPPTGPYTTQALNGPIVLGAAGQPGATATRTIFVDRGRWSKKGATPAPMTVVIQ